MNQENARTEIPLPEKTRGLRFLVVEDHPLQRKMLGIALRAIGAQHINEAAEGREALQLLHGADPRVDIVVCDLDMPNMDGMAFIRHLGDVAEHPALIVTSALDPGLLSSVETMARAYGIRLLGTIEKPATPEKLAPLVLNLDTRPHGGSRPDIPVLSETEVIAALEGDRIIPFFQPKVALSSGALVGAEALARLRHPDLGMMSPASFIGVVEKLGLIDRLTWSMLRQSAAACSAWQRQGLDITVSVNLSQSSLADPSLAGRITSLVSQQNLDPRKMVLEITESAAMTEVGPALENLTRLRMKGFGLSIDDFGTGYSSMQQLSRIPFTELKIDRSFVSGAEHHAQRKIILESSNDLARRLGLKSVAEGVETRSEWDELMRVGCAIAQGYFIAQPMPAAEFLRWAQDWHPQRLQR
jgi:EAL domain-containing protein (putative c-di-GMP-specific phosphodiesterase class I)